MTRRFLGQRALNHQERGKARCPLCGQSLAGDKCAALLDAFETELGNERIAYGQRNLQIKGHKQRIATLKAAVAEIDRDLRKRIGWQRKEAALAHVIKEARLAYDALPAAQDALQVIEARLEKTEYASQDHIALYQVEQQLNELGYDAEAHRRVQADLGTLCLYEDKMQMLRKARSGIETVRLAISQLSQSQAEVEKNLAADQAQAETLRKDH